MAREHPLRGQLVEELHARPPRPGTAPLRVGHLALLTGEDDAPSRAHLAELCARLGASSPPSHVKRFQVEVGDGDAPWSFTWEQHTEFSTYTVVSPGPVSDVFGEDPLARLPFDWRAHIPGQILTSVHVVVIGATGPIAESPMGDHFVRRVVGGTAADGRARIWSDLTLDAAGAVRILVEDHGLTPTQTGRLVQRVLELETYRMTALLALPIARDLAPRLTVMEGRLGKIVGSIDGVEGSTAERALLRELTALAAEVEGQVAATQYRFGATRAYHALCRNRLHELRVGRVEGHATLVEFLDRRLDPAMRTCETMDRRLDALSARVSRAADLLRVRVDVALQEQNVALLQSMDRRAQLQLHLQEVVEGLSVVAVSYYAMGLLGYLVQALVGVGLPWSKETIVGLALPVVVLVSWRGIRLLTGGIR